MPSIISVTVLFLTLGLCSARRPRISPQASAKASAQAIATIATNRSSTLSQPASSTISSLPLYSASSIPTASVNSALFTSSAAPTATPSLNTTSRVATTPDGFKPGAKWQIAIQDPIDPRGGIKPADATVVDVDLFLASKDPTLIPALHVSRYSTSGNTIFENTLIYFNIGDRSYRAVLLCKFWFSQTPGQAPGAPSKPAQVEVRCSSPLHCPPAGRWRRLAYTMDRTQARSSSQIVTGLIGTKIPDWSAA